MPVLEEADSTTKDLEILLLTGLSEVDLICTECKQNPATWWNYHTPGKKCRTPMCTQCKKKCQRYFLIARLTSQVVQCMVCLKYIPINEIRWERME